MAHDFWMNMANAEKAVKAAHATNERAEKKGLTFRVGVSIDDTNPRYVDQGFQVHKSVPANSRFLIPLYRVTVDSEGSMVDGSGWKYVATICRDDRVDRMKEKRNLVFGLGADIPEWAYSIPMACTHCGVSRPRKKVFLIQDENGSLHVCGTSCVEKFTGSSHLEIWCREMQSLSTRMKNLQKESRFWKKGNSADNLNLALVPTIKAALYAATIIRLDGRWINKSNKGNQHGVTTGWLVRGCFIVPHEYREYGYLDPAEEDRALAEKAMAWAAALEPQPSEVFLNNLKTAAMCPTVELGHAGIIAAVVGMYLREKERSANIVCPDSDHVGTIGERIERDVRVTEVRPIESFYSSCAWLVTMNDGINIYKWFTTSEPPYNGTEAHAKFTVKRHEEYRGRKSTVVNRCVFKEKTKATA